MKDYQGFTDSTSFKNSKEYIRAQMLSAAGFYDKEMKDILINKECSNDKF
jgi:hypothetical protein